MADNCCASCNPFAALTMSVVVDGSEPAVAGGPWAGAAEPHGIQRLLRRIRTIRPARHDNTLERLIKAPLESTLSKTGLLRGRRFWVRCFSRRWLFIDAAPSALPPFPLSVRLHRRG